MITSKDIETKVYMCDVNFRDLERFLRRVKVEEKKDNSNKFEPYVSFDTENNDEYRYQSVELFFESEDELAKLREEKVTRVRIDCHGHFEMDFSKTHFTLKYNPGSSVGYALQSAAIDILKLRTRSLIAEFVGSNWWTVVTILLTVLSFTSVDYYGAWFPVFIYGIVWSMGFLFILGFSGARVIMNNEHDNFFYRKKEDIVIATVFMIVGYLLGIIAPIN